MSTIRKPIVAMANHWALLGIAVAGTLLLAASLFMAFEGGTLLDGLYWASTTMTSVGYGDISPATAAGKVMTIAFQLWSLFILLPCAITNIVESVRVDEAKFTHDEQEWQEESIKRIADKVGAVLDPSPSDY